MMKPKLSEEARENLYLAYLRGRKKKQDEKLTEEETWDYELILDWVAQVHRNWFVVQALTTGEGVMSIRGEGNYPPGVFEMRIEGKFKDSSCCGCSEFSYPFRSLVEIGREEPEDD